MNAVAVGIHAEPNHEYRHQVFESPSGGIKASLELGSEATLYATADELMGLSHAAYVAAAAIVAHEERARDAA